MCRFAAYFGHQELLLEEILAKPKNSLIKQSHEAREGLHGINADGFGLAWYDFSVDNTPGIFKSIQPAWNDNNLIHLSKKIHSSCFLAHVRASTVGDVSRNNCHPFSFGEYSLVHNGTIRNFERHKKEIVNTIDENLFLSIKGNTDSEYFFFLIMHFIQHGEDMQNAVKKAINWIVEAQQDCEGFSRINIAITNGREVLGTKFVSKGEKPLSLKYFFNAKGGQASPSLILSSEPLDDYDDLWEEVPENSYIYIDRDAMRVKIESL